MGISKDVPTSAKYSSMYLYISRVLRPIWNYEFLLEIRQWDGKSIIFSFTNDEL